MASSVLILLASFRFSPTNWNSLMLLEIRISSVNASITVSSYFNILIIVSIASAIKLVGIVTPLVR